MFGKLLLLQTEKSFNVTFVNLADSAEVGEVAFLLLGFLSENVALVSVFSLDLSCSGKSKALFSTGISLNFWHFLKY